MKHEMTPLEMIAAKLTEISSAIMELRAQKEVLEEEEKKLVARFSAWYQVYETERPQREIPTSLQAGYEGPAEAQPEAPSEEPAPAFALRIDEQKYGGKTERLKAALEHFGPNGATPKELNAALLAQGVKVSKSFASNTLFRLKQDKEVVVLGNGKYVLPQFLYQPEADRQADIY